MSDQFFMNGRVYNATHHDVEFDDQQDIEYNTAKSISFLNEDEVNEFYSEVEDFLNRPPPSLKLPGEQSKNSKRQTKHQNKINNPPPSSQPQIRAVYTNIDQDLLDQAFNVNLPPLPKSRESNPRTSPITYPMRPPKLPPAESLPRTRSSRSKNKHSKHTEQIYGSKTKKSSSARYDTSTNNNVTNKRKDPNRISLSDQEIDSLCRNFEEHITYDKLKRQLEACKRNIERNEESIKQMISS